MMVIDNKYEIGGTVYLKTDKIQDERLVVSVVIKPGNVFQYQLACGQFDSWHYEIEISAEKNVLIQTS